MLTTQIATVLFFLFLKRQNNGMTRTVLIIATVLFFEIATVLIIDFIMKTNQVM